MNYCQGKASICCPTPTAQPWFHAEFLWFIWPGGLRPSGWNVLVSVGVCHSYVSLVIVVIDVFQRCLPYSGLCVMMNQLVLLTQHLYPELHPSVLAHSSALYGCLPIYCTHVQAKKIVIMLGSKKIFHVVPAQSIKLT